MWPRAAVINGSVLLEGEGWALKLGLQHQDMLKLGLTAITFVIPVPSFHFRSP